MTSFSPLISIVIPVYNGANYMREAIDSALAQTYKNIEIIVINDGSKDGGKTLEIARSYGERIQLIDKPNGGVASALNAGIEAMKGEYLSWLSHDDVYPADKLHRQVEALNKLSNKNVLLFGDYILIDENGHHLGDVSTAHVDALNMPFELYSSQCIHGCTMLVPKLAFDQVGKFRLDLPTTQDYDLWFRISQKFPFAYVPHVLAHSRQHSEQGSRTLKHRQEVLDFFINNFDYLTPKWLDSRYQSEELAGKYVILLKAFSNRQLFPAFSKVLAQARSHLAFKKPGNNVWFVLKALGYFYIGSLKGALKRMIPLPLKNLFRRGLNSPRRGANGNAPSTLDFVGIYKKNIFGSKESRSGSGSTMEQTAYIRGVLPDLFKKYDVKSVLDVPCGDFNWMKHVDLSAVNYTGGDIVPDLIKNNNELYASDNKKFSMLNIITDDLPKVDLILCRDCLVHLKFEDGLNAIRNFKRSGATYLLTTTFTERDGNEELYGIWRTLNLQKAPYNLPAPVEMINEACTEGRMKYTDKSLGLWKLSDIQI